jgi:periplasmic protein TonB
MFESVNATCCLDSTKHFMALLLSVVIHAAVLCTLVLLPLLFLNAIHQEDLVTFLIAPPQVPPPLPPPAPPRLAGGPVRNAVALTRLEVTPRALPRGIPEPPPDGDVPEIGSMLPNIGTGTGVQGPGYVGGVNPGVFALNVNPVVPGPPEPPKRPKPPEPPVTIGGDVLAGKLIFKVDPVYPHLAQVARVSGPVILEAIVDEEGSVIQIKVLSGHILLRDAALEAVKRWKYSPTILNGEPIKVQSAITINFNLR